MRYNAFWRSNPAVWTARVRIAPGRALNRPGVPYSYHSLGFIIQHLSGNCNRFFPPIGKTQTIEEAAGISPRPFSGFNDVVWVIILMHLFALKAG